MLEKESFRDRARTKIRSIKRSCRIWLRGKILRCWDLYLKRKGLVSTGRSCFPERDALFSKPKGIMPIEEINDAVERDEKMFPQKRGSLADIIKKVLKKANPALLPNEYEYEPQYPFGTRHPLKIERTNLTNEEINKICKEAKEKYENISKDT
jgi:hypothetical protein